jgi:hypothetical protein
VRQTIKQDLPNETNFLRSFDAFRAGIENMVDVGRSSAAVAGIEPGGWRILGAGNLELFDQQEDVVSNRLTRVIEVSKARFSASENVRSRSPETWRPSHFDRSIDTRDRRIDCFSPAAAVTKEHKHE